ncbi:Lar family restriction alleviation protein [Paraburkholderia antibiotica]|uniref:Restriction alleviation protein Lar n=1 Tax=Paraburkholderia antibiotica TaxID=2728839 RepID=A0A7Y0A1Q2_9BURK|nr:Lar family restriction alleviation protein [Paraburkholderia antibiotica]NML34886.1 hypothetical protein [Paraburkholderia antibiotica]
MTSNTRTEARASLSSCPFCGGHANLYKEGLDERFAYADRITYRCSGCGASVSAMGIIPHGGYADNSTVEKRALDAWNRRAPTPAVQADATIAAGGPQEPIYVRATDLDSLKDPRISGKGCFLNKEPRDGFVPLYAAPLPREAATVTLTVEQRKAVWWAILTAEQSEPKSGTLMYRRAQDLRAILADPQAAATVTLTACDADMVWPAYDGETSFHSIDEAVQYEVDQAWPTQEPLELRLDLAKRIPAATIRIFNITENGHEWEIVAPAHVSAGEKS